ncbi:tetratricopeptide repeat protein [Adhaeribacter swui]|uniref:Tetratricopeptide repeat protein n=1 Tax=Adhaeribacter swui TaxID=2086471 RepID=A0A7G7GCT0_9BACT|nr:tetratricopeptide repeat protein [Adhaeribacter swui]QNF34964.1 tetratricopeptide repeat protein [Adhaeribacter swui]
MKKLLLTTVAMVSMQLAMAQKSEVTNALLSLKNGTLDKAKTSIDKAVVHEKTANDPKAWFTKGEVYAAYIDNPIFGKQVPNAVEEAFQAYDKAIALDKDGEWGKQAAAKKDNLYAGAFNNAVNAYNEKRYDEAIKAYTMAQNIRPQDTTAYVYAAYAAEAKQDFPLAKENYKKLLAMNHKTPMVYNRLIYFAKEVDKNEAETASLLQDAVKTFPNNKDFMLEELNLYVKAGKGKEAIGKLENAIKVDPNNPNLYNVLGSLYDQTGEKDKARQNYEAALKIDPANFDANFNLGVYHYNKGADINNKLSKLSAANQQKSGAKMAADSKQSFNAAIPYFEAAHKSNPQDVSTMETLARVYIQMGKTKEAEAMNKKVDALKK